MRPILMGSELICRCFHACRKSSDVLKDAVIWYKRTWIEEPFFPVKTPFKLDTYVW